MPQHQPMSNSLRCQTSPCMCIIQEHFVVLADNHARSDRTTIATNILRKIKQMYKERNKNELKSRWIPSAIEEFHKQLKARFPPTSYPTIQEEVGLVLVKCSRNTKDRVDGPCIYGYENDKVPSFSKAKAKEALEFFLAGRDAPVLSMELSKHRENLNRLRKSDSPPPKEMMDDFENTLDFFEMKLSTHSEHVKVLSSKLLDTLKPINPLKEQWKLLASYKSSSTRNSSTKSKKDLSEDGPQNKEVHIQQLSPSEQETLAGLLSIGKQHDTVTPLHKVQSETEVKKLSCLKDKKSVQVDVANDSSLTRERAPLKRLRRHEISGDVGSKKPKNA